MEVLVAKVLDLVIVFWYIRCPGNTQINNFLSIDAFLNNNFPLIDSAYYIDNTYRKMSDVNSSFDYLDSSEFFTNFTYVEINKDKANKELTYSIKHMLHT